MFRCKCLLVFVIAVCSNSAVLAKGEPQPQTDQKVTLDVSLSSPVMLADKKRTTYVKVGLTGFALPNSEDRPPVNIAIVIDKSGSMTGRKIEKAKEAAIAAIHRLRSSDIVSVVVYDQGVQVVVPATRLTDKEDAIAKIRQISAGGSTALFAGVSKGSAEVRKFLDRDKVNRVILLSDGQANVGPESPSELGDLGASLFKEKIAVTTLGLGLDYNEDLMTQLAVKSNGNHLFIENADELMAIFDYEFNDVLSVVAQEIVIQVRIPEGVRPVRVLGHDAEIQGQEVMIQLNQLYAEQERFVLLEVEVPATAESATRVVANVDISYANMLSKETDRLSTFAAVTFTKNAQQTKATQNRDVIEKWVLLFANEQNRLATRLRDEGRVDDARRLLLSNSDYLSTNAIELGSEVLRVQRDLNYRQSQVIDDKNWKKTRKLMRRDNAAVEQQTPGSQAKGEKGSMGGMGGFGGGFFGGYGK